MLKNAEQMLIFTILKYKLSFDSYLQLGSLTVVMKKKTFSVSTCYTRTEGITEHFPPTIRAISRSCHFKNVKILKLSSFVHHTNMIRLILLAINSKKVSSKFSHFPFCCGIVSFFLTCKYYNLFF